MSGFDRIKPPDRRLLERPDSGGLDDADPAGRAALFSSAPGEAPAGGTLGLAVRCSRCGSVSSLDTRTALRAAFPLFLVAPWRRHPVFAVCPACRRRWWSRCWPLPPAGSWTCPVTVW
jgi:hypothetical protein